MLQIIHEGINMGANSPLNPPSVEDECGGAIFSEVPFTLVQLHLFNGVQVQLFSARYFHFYFAQL